MKTIAITLGSVILITLIKTIDGLLQCQFKNQICGDRCSDWLSPSKPSKCTCGGSKLPKDKFCCIPSHTSCTGVGDVNCPNGTALNFHQPCEEECSISTDNYVAITSTYDKVDCSKKDSFFFSKVSSGTDEHMDFKEYCGTIGYGKTCGSSTSSVSFKQCHIKFSNLFNVDLGTMCLSRTDKPLLVKDKKSTTKGRRNLRSEIKSVTAKQLICLGQDEEYNWEDVCKYEGWSRPCQLKSGDILELNPIWEGNHDLCTDYSFWSSIEDCITDPNEMTVFGLDDQYALYPYARKCIAHEKYQHKSQKSTKNSCGKYKGNKGWTNGIWNGKEKQQLDICPNSTNETDCKGNEFFFCKKSKSCLDMAKICDGIVHCIFGEDEAWNLCNSKFTFEETATRECYQSNRGTYDLFIKATPCSGECRDENCDTDWKILSAFVSFTFAAIIFLCSFVHFRTTKKYPTIVSDDPEIIDEEIANARQNYKGNVLANIKNENDLDTCSKLLKTPSFFDPLANSLERYKVKSSLLPVQIFLKYFDLLQDALLLHYAAESMGGISIVFEHPTLFSSVVVLVLLTSVSFPMAISGMRMAISAPHVIFWEAEGFLKIVFSILTFLTVPLHSLILALRQYQIDLRLRADPGSKDIEARTAKTKKLLAKSDEIHYHLCSHTKLELGLETIFQLCLKLILLAYAKSSTRTTEGLSQMFEKNVDLTNINYKTFEGAKSLYLVILLYTSTVWSLISNVKSHINGLSANRKRFPFASKMIVAVYAFFASTSRVVAIILFFSPSLGLFNLLQHWKGEHVQWHPFLLENLITNQTVTFEGMPPKPVDFIFEDPTLRTTLSSISFNETFLKEVKDRPFTIDGYIQFGNSSQIKWSQIDHTHHYVNGTIVWPSYTLYTGLTLKIFFFVFIVISMLQVLIIFLVKHFFAKGFRNFNILEKLIHCLETSHLPYNSEEWDTPKGTAEEHIERMKANQMEGFLLILVNLVFKLVMLCPIYYLAFKIKGRHNILYLSIGFRAEELYSMEVITWLVVGSTAYILFGTLLESIFFNLYNSTFHPFAKILDISNTSQASSLDKILDFYQGIRTFSRRFHNAGNGLIGNEDHPRILNVNDTGHRRNFATGFNGIKKYLENFSNSLFGKWNKTQEHEMEQMEEGNENDTANINNITVGNENNIICHKELQPEVIIPEINQQHDQNSEIIEDIQTIQDSKEVLCQGILLDILDKIVKQSPDPDSEVDRWTHL